MVVCRWFAISDVLFIFDGYSVLFPILLEDVGVICVINDVAVTRSAWYMDIDGLQMVRCILDQMAESLGM
jgi:hypothetical protein